MFDRWRCRVGNGIIKLFSCRATWYLFAYMLSCKVLQGFLYHFHASLIWFSILFGLNICSICYKTNNWELISKYSKRFIKAGVKLRQTTFDTWMEFAVQRGLSSLGSYLLYLTISLDFLCDYALVIDQSVFQLWSTKKLNFPSMLLDSLLPWISPVCFSSFCVWFAMVP